jgi:hypothetical protein
LDSVLVCWCYDLKSWLGSGWPEFEAAVRPVDSIPLQDLSRVDGAKYQEVLVNVRRPRKVGTRGRRVEHELGDEVTNVLGVAGGSGELIKTLWGAFIRSGMVLGGDAVLVDESAEPLVPADRAGGRRRDRLCWLAGLGRSGAERAVRPMPAVVVDELVQDMP